MATMHPQFNDRELEQENPTVDGNGSRGENALYRQLRDTLPNNWHVFWHRTMTDARGYTHEFDFLVFVPGKGVVNVDAKGYGWGVDGNRIYCEYEGVRNYKDPFMQANSAISTVNNIFRAHIGGSWGAYGCLVAFISNFNHWGNEFQYIDRFEERVQRDRNALKDQILAVLDTDTAIAHHQYFTTGVMNSLVEKLNQESRPQYNRINDADFRGFDECSAFVLTAKQRRVSTVLNNCSNVHVIGAAGTGKTVVAWNLAEQFAREGKRVLYVCFNELLQKKMARDLHGKNFAGNIRSSTFYKLPNMRLTDGRRLMDLCGWAQYANHRGNIAYNQAQTPNLCVNGRPNFGEISRFIVAGLGRFGLNNGGHYDVLLVDEAQDMTNEQIMALFGLLSEERKIVIFSDQGQMFYNQEWQLNLQMFGDERVEEVALDENLRNTEQIHSHFKDYQERNEVYPIICNGVKEVEEVYDVGALLRRLFQEGRRPGDIAVIASRSEDLQQFNSVHNQVTNRPVPISNDIERWWNNGCILKDTVRRVKGLESPIVIFIQTKADENDDALLYVGESRARYELYIWKKPCERGGRD